jgi:CIC family chloride channel protein
MFETSEATFAHPESLVVYFILGIVLAALGWCYVKTFYGLRDHVFERLPVPRHLRPAIGGALTGLLGLLAPQAISLGYGWVQLGLLDRLTLRDYITGALGKIVATGFTISSGGSGGVFGPAVVIGGFAGGAVGTGFARLLPSWHLETQSFILVGMAAFFGGAAKAPIGAILMITEMTAGYGLLVPLMLTSAITFMLLPRRVSIYEEQVDGSVNSPAHLERYMRHLAATMKTSVGGESPGRDDTVRLLATTTATLPAAEPTAPGAVANASFVEARVTETGGVVGRCLGELALPAGALAVAVRRGVTTTIVSEGTRLEPGDLVVFLADEAGAEGVRRLFRADSTSS